ncbi:MAG: hypothetical protein Kow0092_37880 [Deferrisomatales bacterium]
MRRRLATPSWRGARKTGPAAPDFRIYGLIPKTRNRHARPIFHALCRAAPQTLLPDIWNFARSPRRILAVFRRLAYLLQTPLPVLLRRRGSRSRGGGAPVEPELEKEVVP